MAAMQAILFAVLILARVLVAAADTHGAAANPDPQQLSAFSLGGSLGGNGNGGSCNCVKFCQGEKDVQKCTQDCHTYCGKPNFIKWLREVIGIR